MKKIAVFGKPGSGKSTVSQKLAGATGICVSTLDTIAYEKDGKKISREKFDQAYKEIMVADNWIIDGLGPIDTFNARLEAADTLIYIDLPYWVSYWFVTKRLLKGLFVKPIGWPEGASILKGTIQSHKMLKLSPQFWNKAFNKRLEKYSKSKKVIIINSVAELRLFIDNL